MTAVTAPRYGAGAASSVSELLAGSPYVAYTYSYPHKTAYRPFAERLRLRELWAEEDRSALFLYVHIPFCEMRCGFCNLFTFAKPEDDYTRGYLRTLRRQAEVVAGELDEVSWARLAVGGGTPTQLDAVGLEDLFSIITDVMGCDTAQAPSSVEMSPETVTPEKMAILRAFHTDRASIGVQSFVREETKAVRRPQDRAVAHAAIETMRAAGFPIINIDLIYGIRGQTRASWLASIDEALLHQPEELYLYPLYVRPLTGLGNSARAWDDERLGLYRAGRDYLLERGYEQVSMRMFRRVGSASPAGPVYCCQSDGMVGLGAGARSYTDSTHHCTEYAVGRRGVKEILDDFVTRDDSAHAYADYGYVLDEEERRRRHLILSLLAAEGLARAPYLERFGRDVMEEFSEIELLIEADLAEGGEVVRLTERGLALTDTIGPWLYSTAVRSRMTEFELR